VHYTCTHAWNHLPLDAVGNVELHQIRVLGALVFGSRIGIQKSGAMFAQMLELTFFSAALNCPKRISAQDWQAKGNVVCL